MEKTYFLSEAFTRKPLQSLPIMLRQSLVKCILGTICLLFPVIPLAAQTESAPAPKTVLVLGLKVSQFYANVYSVDELAFLNDSTGLTRANAKRVIGTYNQQLLNAFAGFSSPQYRFIVVESQAAAGIHAHSNYVDWRNEFKEPYTSLESDSAQDLHMRNLMRAYQADFLISVNFYEIISGYTPTFLTPDIRTRHTIDYEIFNPNLAIVTAGRASLLSRDIRAASMQAQYRNFVQTVTERLTIAQTSRDKATLQQQYLTLQEKRLKNVWGAGFSLGWENPYGWVGAELFRNIGYKLDIGAGLGFARNGFNAGIGARYYLLAYGKKYKPFVSAHLAWASGNKINMGGEEDENGNQIAQEDVSTYRIPAGTAVHLKTGFRWLSHNRALLLGGGYAIPFGNYKAVWDEQTKESASRQRLADAFAVGGFEIGFTYLVYFSKVR